MKEESFIQDFFVDRSIFITGATGFMGKVLIEKLLRSCPYVAKIYLLLRPKKGMNIDDRLKNLLTNKLFDKVRAEQPSSFEKLVPVAGNIVDEGLGLLSADRQILIDKVSIIFHVAANVKFDDSLKDAIFANTRSTRDMCILASNMKNLAAFVHVSTAYCQIDKHVVDEILYPVDVDWKRMIEIAESVDEEILKILTIKYMGAMPNTYVFTKKLAEQVISDYSQSLPCVILRPSIVISTMYEPIPGWLDNFNGPIGTLVGGGKGVLRVLYADPAITSDYMPVDFVIKIMIMAAWTRGTKTLSDDQTVHIYHCTANNLKRFNISQITQTGFEQLQEVPMDTVIWFPHTMLIKYRWIYYILMLLLHILPAICIDGVLKLYGAKPILLKLQRKVYVMNSALSHFVLHEWSFRNLKCLDLIDSIGSKNKGFAISYVDVDIREYFKNGIIGAKMYLLNEDMSNLKAKKKHRKRMDMLQNTVKTIFIVTILWILYNNNILTNVANILAYMFNMCI